MKFDLRYFTGTGNSLKILKTCAEEFSKQHQVNIAAITKEKQIPQNTDIVVFCFPVYAFGIPRICKKYLKNLNKFNSPKKAVILITAGDADESGFSVKECEKILQTKNCTIIYSSVFEMPINWTVSMNPPAKEEAETIIRNGVEKAKNVANEILNGINKYHKFNIPKRYGSIGLYKDYWLFKLGVRNLWKMFKVYESCNGCGICAKSCPTQSIAVINKNPIWKSTCEQCMRCVNVCPSKAIYQSFGGNTQGRNRYLEPGFKPLID
jgi:ferredoxin